MIYTIGYGNRSFDDFYRILKRYAIQAVLDTRSHPFSRHNHSYNRSVLERLLVGESVAYIFLGDRLGGRPAQACYYTNGKVDYAKLAAGPEFQSGIQQLLDLAENFKEVAVLCSELRPESCHRARLIAPRLLALQVPLLHIDETGVAISHDAVSSRPGFAQQPSLL